MVPLTLSIRIGYFPWSLQPPLGRPDTLTNPSLREGTPGSQENLVGTALSKEQSGLLMERRFVYFLWNLTR